jgi:cytidylate kinase
MTVIAIDGTFASGKGTLAKRLAHHFGFAYLDTGKLYRAVATKILELDGPLDDPDYAADIAKGLKFNDLENRGLKSGGAGAAASKIAIFRPVRAALYEFQRNFAENPGNDYKGAILDGRDIGTVICPDADIKLYIDAKPEVRAERRYQELLSYGEDVSYEEVLAQLGERDLRDKTRKEAPLKPAANAHLLDTTNLGIDAAFEAARHLIAAVLERQV